MNDHCYDLKELHGITASCEFLGIKYEDCIESNISMFQRTGQGLRKYGGDIYRTEITRLTEMKQKGFKSIFIYNEDGTLLYAASIDEEIKDLTSKCERADMYNQQKVNNNSYKRMMDEYDEWFEENQTFDPIKGY